MRYNNLKQLKYVTRILKSYFIYTVSSEIRNSCLPHTSDSILFIREALPNTRNKYSRSQKNET